ncbi:hypothetical protein D3C87_2113480 [compost metagenome]
MINKQKIVIVQIVILPIDRHLQPPRSEPDQLQTRVLMELFSVALIEGEICRISR